MRLPKILSPLGASFATTTVINPLVSTTTLRLPDPPVVESYGALSRNQSGAGIDVGSATAISSGDPSSHWTISGGRLYPSAAGDTADLNAGPYTLTLDDGAIYEITIEADTWDVATQAEYDVIAGQSQATIAGKTIAFRHSGTINLGITGGSGTPFRRMDLRDSANGDRPLTLKGRFGAVGTWADYCAVDKVAQARGVRGLKLQHIRFTAVAETKVYLLGESSYNIDDITIDDCWITGEVGDPNGNYSTSSNYPNFNKDLVTTQGSASNSVGNITITNSLVEWGDNNINVSVTVNGDALTITDTEVRYFYEDAIKVSRAQGTANASATIEDNFIHDPVGLASDSAGQHPDGIQLKSTNSAGADWTGISVRNNVLINGTSRGNMQAIFMDDFKSGGTDSGFFFNGATISNNIVAIDAVQGIVIGQAKNCLVDNNTVVGYDEAAVSTPTVQVGSGNSDYTSGGGNTVSDTIADSFDVVSGSTETNNITTGLNGATTAYSTLFDGPGFDPETEAEAKAFFNTKAAASGAGADFP